MIERVGCSWFSEDPKTAQARADYPESAAWHDAHGDDLSKCDTWLCVCGKTDSRGGSWDDFPDPSLTCTACGRIYNRDGIAIKGPGNS